MKQLPLLFAVMAGKTSEDYTQVFKGVMDILHNETRVKEFMVDFEAGMWQGLREVFVDPTIKGCAFHWNQAVWRHVQSLGLQTERKNNRRTPGRPARVCGQDMA
ncbi:uncharacterized protein LOC127864396 [Dreissena polymorpha]|uniref:uncharacterized protein LOC127864396 n=1 Tax=Dreissena polymorpha TaxID=45954 RepID=UPI0022641691|nr:uncharacterized protein LOC127864396 [Dreissena polymorpha]